MNKCDFETAPPRGKHRIPWDILNGWMIWFFDRNGEKLRYEISHDRSAGRYRVIITHPDGSESVEEVDEPTELIERSVQLMNSLRGDGWRVA